jgi:SnoaL-like domain
MASSTSLELQRLIDIEDIRQLKARFGFLMDAFCGPHEESLARDFGALFTEDATIDSAAFGHFKGRAQILDLFGKAIPSQMQTMWHSFQNPLIEINGDVATGRWTMMAYIYPANAQPSTPVLTFGRYVDEYRRVDGSWRLAKLFFETSQLDSSALDGAAQGTSQALAGNRAD